ncbi:hypothetical protein Agub_g13105, partial [Astrephomene gubernaculifera]
LSGPPEALGLSPACPAACAGPAPGLLALFHWFLVLLDRLLGCWQLSWNRRWRVSTWLGQVVQQPFSRAFLLPLECPFDPADNAAKSLGCENQPKHQEVFKWLAAEVADSLRLLRATRAVQDLDGAILGLFGLEVEHLYLEEEEEEEEQEEEQAEEQGGGEQAEEEEEAQEHSDQQQQQAVAAISPAAEGDATPRPQHHRKHSSQQQQQRQGSPVASRSPSITAAGSSSPIPRVRSRLLDPTELQQQQHRSSPLAHAAPPAAMQHIAVPSHTDPSQATTAAAASGNAPEVPATAPDCAVAAVGSAIAGTGAPAGEPGMFEQDAVMVEAEAADGPVGRGGSGRALLRAADPAVLRANAQVQRPLSPLLRDVTNGLQRVGGGANAAADAKGAPPSQRSASPPSASAPPASAAPAPRPPSESPPESFLPFEGLFGSFLQGAMRLFDNVAQGVAELGEDLNELAATTAATIRAVINDDEDLPFLSSTAAASRRLRRHRLQLLHRTPAATANGSAGAAVSNGTGSGAQSPASTASGQQPQNRGAAAAAAVVDTLGSPPAAAGQGSVVVQSPVLSPTRPQRELPQSARQTPRRKQQQAGARASRAASTSILTAAAAVTRVTPLAAVEADAPQDGIVNVQAQPHGCGADGKVDGKPGALETSAAAPGVLETPTDPAGVQASTGNPPSMTPQQPVKDTANHQEVMPLADITEAAAAAVEALSLSTEDSGAAAVAVAASLPHAAPTSPTAPPAAAAADTLETPIISSRPDEDRGDAVNADAGDAGQDKVEGSLHEPCGEQPRAVPAPLDVAMLPSNGPSELDVDSYTPAAAAVAAAAVATSPALSLASGSAGFGAAVGLVRVGSTSATSTCAASTQGPSSHTSPASSPMASSSGRSPSRKQQPFGPMGQARLGQASSTCEGPTTRKAPPPLPPPPPPPVGVGGLRVKSAAFRKGAPREALSIAAAAASHVASRSAASPSSSSAPTAPAGASTSAPSSPAPRSVVPLASGRLQELAECIDRAGPGVTIDLQGRTFSGPLAAPAMKVSATGLWLVNGQLELLPEQQLVVVAKGVRLQELIVRDTGAGTAAAAPPPPSQQPAGVASVPPVQAGSPVAGPAAAAATARPAVLVTKQSYAGGGELTLSRCRMILGPGRGIGIQIKGKGCSIVADGCHVSGSAMAAVQASDATLTLTGCTLEGGSGHGLCCRDNAVANATDCCLSRFDGACAAVRAGASLELSNCTLTGVGAAKGGGECRDGECGDDGDTRRLSSGGCSTDGHAAATTESTAGTGGSGGVGLLVEGKGSAVVARGSSLSGFRSKAAVVVTVGATANLEECKATDSLQGALVGTRGGRLLAIRCELSRHSGEGLVIGEGATADLRHCRLQGNIAAGVRVGGVGSMAVMRGCEVASNGACGVAVEAAGCASLDGCNA